MQKNQKNADFITKNLSLLYIEDEKFIRENAILFLEDQFKIIYEAKDGVEGFEIYNTQKPDIIITDISMPRMSGLELCEKIRTLDQKTPIIITTAHADTHYLLKAIELNLIKYLIKPIEEDQLLEAINICCEKLSLNNSNIVQLTLDFTFDTFNKTLFNKNILIKLTKSELLLLDILIKKIDHIVSYEEIEYFIWYDKVMSSDALKSVVRSVRNKIDKSIIENFSKQGYKIKIYKGD